MLVLTRKIGEKIIIGSDIEIMLVDIKNGQVKLGIVAPKDMQIYRKEICNTEMFFSEKDK